MSGRVLSGIDEAGLGPLLGPLVFASVTLAGPPGGDPWRLLAAAVSRGGRPGRLRVDDSKRVFAGRRDLGSLERTALAFLSTSRGRLPEDLAELLSWCRGGPLEGCPWYRDLGVPLPAGGRREEVVLATHLLGRAMDRAGVRLLDVSVRFVEVGEWNGLLDRTGNKAAAHWAVAAEMIAAAAEAAGGGGAHLVVDRCGGRKRYGACLGGVFPGARLEVVREEERRSVYRVPRPGGPLTVSFLEKGEDHAFPVAAASCMAKYVRELMVERINHWFRERVEGLVPTAGYVTDARRFLREAAALVDAPGFPRDLLVRAR